MSALPVRFDSELRNLIKDRVATCDDKELASYTNYLINYIVYLEGKVKVQRERITNFENLLKDIETLG